MPRLEKLEFRDGYGERDAFETPMRGYRSDVTALLDDGNRYRVHFYDPVRLTQELQMDVSAGKPCPFLTDPGMIVVPEVNLEAMTRAVQELAAQGFFDSFRPLPPEPK
jgi:hypothetical protein